ncbi:hypothetical protein [Thiohalocapsa marina]|uniref:hypothetical protein n=1 Tax=Thiohalocapsa marina TaxID=424902 RepID=UPI0036DFA4A6
MKEKQPFNGENGSLLPPPDRPLLTKSQYARHRGVSPAAITRAIKEKRVVTAKVGKRELIDQKASDALWAAIARPRADSPGPVAGALDADASAPDSAAAVSLALKRATLRLQEAKAEAANIEIDKQAGLLVERVTVEYLLRDLGEAVRSRVENLPGQLAPVLVGIAGDESALYLEIERHTYAVLEDLSQHFYRQAGRHLPDIRVPEVPNNAPKP